ncbi:unnamed protein product [Clonostachys rosea]|uniref:AB hydrolase-1 domain-containing protein n=1 Tax=Bionectria ochroleuca TaxID=29856 RepID=A0ABY6U875_BIOOC|nr:unnamed protein product [Clonostachys rosea]
MTNFILSYQWLFYTRPPPGPPSPVPEGLERHWIDTAQGKLEVLSATPPQTVPASDGPPIYFCHGGMGCAWVWTEYMQYLAARGVRSYAISLRGHGDSWYPSYLRMLFGTTRRMLSDDLVAGLRWVEQRENRRVVLVGHSSGGGLSQGVLSEGRVDVEGLALLGAVPGYGSMGVYQNWMKLDPWFGLRLIFHGYHSNSPLSHPILTRRVFFGDKFPLSAVIPFQRRMNRYESFLWPFSMMMPFASAGSVLQHIHHGKILVMAGSQDKIMPPKITTETAAYYREASASPNGEDSVRMELVEGAGHHLQNDIQWEDGAAKLWDFYKSIT